MTTQEKALAIEPGSLRDAPALIEVLLPAQKLSIESHKEQMAVHGKTLTALGSYWKGRKPLILNKACILGALLPATANLRRDLEVFEMLMGMDEASLRMRMGEKKDRASRDFLAEHRHISKAAPYRDWVRNACRPEECGDSLFDHVWAEVNEHLGTRARSFPELVEQLGIMRFGHRPRVADTFSGSGQIPFEAARLGCDVYASDLNPIACMLTWGAFNIVGASAEKRVELKRAQRSLAEKVREKIDELDVETDGKGARAKVFLYCLEVTCPETGWAVPLLPSRVVSKGLATIAELVPDAANKRYEIRIVNGVSAAGMLEAEAGTVQDGAMVHTVNGRIYRARIATLRGDYTDVDKNSRNRLRRWKKSDFAFRETDIFRERLYAIQWQFRKFVDGREKQVSEFRSVTTDDMRREQAVIDYVSQHLSEWQQRGLVPDVEIEPGFNTKQPIWERGWTYWHHLFNPRQLLCAAIAQSVLTEQTSFSFLQSLNWNSRLSHWSPHDGGGGAVKQVFYNQAFNTFFNNGCRGSAYLNNLYEQDYSSSPIPASVRARVENHEVAALNEESDIFVTDPPYGDAVKYEEILEFFIAWLRKNPPEEFSRWIWDSRRTLAIKGEDDDFRRGMIAAYKRMAECMPDNGLQIIMFTHQSGSIWADMAHIVWAAGLQVTAAWYVVTETDSALREGGYVKGTVLLVLRKRKGHYKSSRGDLGFEIQEEVEEQVRTLTGLNQQARDLYRDENLFSDADLQMAGYAAALRVLTRYAVIDGRDMAQEAQRPRVAGQTTLVEELIDFAVTVANQALVPGGLEKSHWDPLRPAERFYLKMLELEAQGAKTLDNYQNFAKAFKVRNFRVFLASDRANSARLKSAVELGRAETGDTSEFFNTPLRALLYALMELQQDRDGDEVLAHLAHNFPEYFNRRDLLVALADYLARQLVALREEEASAARVLRDLIRNQRL